MKKVLQLLLVTPVLIHVTLTTIIGLIAAWSYILTGTTNWVILVGPDQFFTLCIITLICAIVASWVHIFWEYGY